MAGDTGFERFKSVLAELFQLDDEPLDSGMHRIVGLKRSELEELITGPEGLIRTVEEALTGAVEHLSTVRREKFLRFFRAEAGERYRPMLEDPEGNRAELREFIEKNAPAGELEELLSIVDGLGGVEEGPGSDPLEAAIYNNVASFFEMYYANGDFGYRSRSSSVFSVPYDGRDVHFHWKFQGSYYVKSGRTLPKIEFTPDVKPRRKIRYQLVAGAINGSESSDGAEDMKFYALDHIRRERGGCTVDLRLASAPTPKHELFEEIAKVAYGIDADLADLYLRGADGKPVFKDPTPQSAVIRDGARRGVSDLQLPAERYVALLARKRGFRGLGGNVAAREAELRKDEKVGLFLLLDRYLNRFLVGTDADYFVQEDLGAFLRREKENFVKDVIFADVDALLAADPSSPTAAIARGFNGVADRIIEVLEAVENFERDLFLLAKKVTRTDYLISLGKVPKALHRKVFANKELLRAFADVYGVEIKRTADLEKFPTLPVNTRLFDDAVTEELVAAIPDLAEECVGLAVKGDNLHALNLLGSAYAGSIRFTYIDPPYNTGSDGFLYKDHFRHASWLSMLGQALTASQRLLSEDGCTAISIDDTELAHLCELIDLDYGAKNELARLVWDRNRKNDAKFFSVGHEYMVVLAKNQQLLREQGTEFREAKPGAAVAREFFEELLERYGNDWDSIGEAWRSYVRGLADPDAKKWLSRYRAVGPDEGNPNVDPRRGPYRTDRDISWPGGNGPRYEVLHPKTGKPVPVPDRGWGLADEAAFWREYDDGRVRFGPDEATAPTQVTYLSEADRQVMRSVNFSYAQAAAQQLKELFGEAVFQNPKNWEDIRRLSAYVSRDGDTVLDYFAGSGTTGHAILDLNRRGDVGRRRFILIDNGDHFESVLVPRLERVMFSSEWVAGEPRDSGESGIETIVKIQEIETFEDVLDGLVASGTGRSPSTSPSYMFRPEAQEVRNVLDLRRPFANRIADERSLDLLETYCYLKGYRLRSVRNHWAGRRKYRVAHTDSDRLVVFRDVKPGENDVETVRTILEDYEGIVGLDVNADIDRRHAEKLDVDVVTVSSEDFDVGATWS